MMIVPPMFTVPNGLYVVPSPLNRRPCITAFGTRFPPKFAYPSQVQTYVPFSVPTLQTCATDAGPAVADVPVPSAIAAAKHSDAQAKAKEVIVFLTSFVFMIVFFLILFCCCWPSLLSQYEESFLAVHRVQ